MFFLDVAREIRDHVQAWEIWVALPAKNGTCYQSAAVHAGLPRLIERLQSITERCALSGENSPGYAKLLDALRQCQQGMTELLFLEAELSG